MLRCHHGVTSWVSHTHQGDIPTAALLVDGGREIEIKAPTLIYGRSSALTPLKITEDLEVPHGSECHAVI